jgi:hypothetical protein
LRPVAEKVKLALRAAPAKPQYFMYERKIASFVPASLALKVVDAP